MARKNSDEKATIVSVGKRMKIVKDLRDAYAILFMEEITEEEYIEFNDFLDA
ncbi:MAG: hypothetical protein WCQ65_10680 [Fermentimonas sp.]